MTLRMLTLVAVGLLLCGTAAAQILAPIMSAGSGTASTYALVSHTAAQTVDKQNVTTSSIDTTGANLIIIAQTASDATLPTPTDNKSNTYTKLASHTTGGVTNAFYYVSAPTVGTGHTFSSNSGTDHFQGIAVAAFSGAKTSSPFDLESGNTTPSAESLSPGVITPSENKELVVYSLGDSFTSAVTTNDGTITILQQLPFVAATAFGIALAYKIQSTAAATNPTWSWTGAARAETSLATFKAQ